MFNLLYIIPLALIFLVLLSVTVKFIRRRLAANAQHYPESDQLYVGNLPYNINPDQLKKAFGEYGDVQSVRVIRNPRTGRSKGFAFVTYAHVKSAKKALAANGEELKGRAMVVRMAKPR